MGNDAMDFLIAPLRRETGLNVRGAEPLDREAACIVATVTEKAGATSVSDEFQTEVLIGRCVNTT
jgi:hypothetical protein